MADPTSGSAEPPKPILPDTLEAIGGFIAYLQNKDSSPCTIRPYRKDLLDFFGRVQVPPAEVKKAHVFEYLSYLASRNLKGRTIRRIMAPISSFYKYLMLIEKVSHNPISGVQMPKVVRNQMPFVAEADAEAMLALPDATYQDRMDLLILELLYSTGARRGDLAYAKLADLNLEGRYLFVIGKGKKAAKLKLNPSAIARLTKYLSERPQTACERLLVTPKGRPWHSSGVYDSVKRAATRAGIKTNVTVHAWRRGIATILMKKGAKLKDISGFLRHSNIATTDAYLLADDESVQAALDEFHPRA